jgi:hypothetical protein
MKQVSLLSQLQKSIAREVALGSKYALGEIAQSDYLIKKSACYRKQQAIRKLAREQGVI